MKGKEATGLQSGSQSSSSGHPHQGGSLCVPRIEATVRASRGCHPGFGFQFLSAGLGSGGRAQVLGLIGTPGKGDLDGLL